MAHPDSGAGRRRQSRRWAKQLARLVEDLLDVSRIAMGRAVLDSRSLDLAELVASVIETWRQSGKLVHHDLSTQLVPAWVNADRTRLEQVVSNLIDNALKFTPSGGRIAVSVASNGATATLVIDDSGVGIPEHELARVFELFVQGSQDLSRSQGGIGVGLALVKRLVQMHGGTVTARSAGEDQGSTFTVTLPACSRNAVPATGTDTTNGAQRKSRRVLIVEDNDDRAGDDGGAARSARPSGVGSGEGPPCAGALCAARLR